MPIAPEPVIFSYEELDRMFFERLRLEVVAEGLLPDVVLYQGNANGYKAAKEAIEASGGQVVEIFGPGTPEARDKKTYNRITMHRVQSRKGGWQGAGTHFYREKEVNGVTLFDKYLYPPSNFNIRYELRSITYSTKYDRIVEELISTVIPAMGSMSSIATDGSETGKHVFVEYHQSLKVYSDQFIERVFSFTVHDVWVGKLKPIYVDIPELTTVIYDVTTDEGLIPNTTTGEKKIYKPSNFYYLIGTDAPAGSTIQDDELKGAEIYGVVYVDGNPIIPEQVNISLNPTSGILNMGTLPPLQDGQEVFFTTVKP